MRVGMGFDVHPFREGRRLVLGGVEFDGPVGLAGHSDADVLTHAVIDAILGAAGLGDIGHHFPDDDARWRDASSIEMLREALARLESENYQIVNVDVTVIAERPRIADRIPLIRERIGQVLGIGPDFVSVKATTAERLGTIGREEGIAALAVALIDRLGEPGAP